MRKKIGIVIYANPDHYPPVMNAIVILAKEFDVEVFCRNQGAPQHLYPDSVKLFRFGELKTPRGKEIQRK